MGDDRNRTDTDCVSVSYNSETVMCVGDELEVITENFALLGQKVSVGDVVEVVDIEETPSGPELVIDSESIDDVYLPRWSPTSVAEGLCLVDYKNNPDEQCLKLV